MKASTSNGRLWIWAAAILAVAFGLLTLREGGGVLFGDEARRQAAGHYVPFVLWFNFLAGFAYIVAGIALAVRARWAAHLALGIAAATLAVFAAFGWYVVTGGAYELRTVIAMTLRSTVWLAIALVAYRFVPPSGKRVV
jgi:uncharacterized membrane protein